MQKEPWKDNSAKPNGRSTGTILWSVVLSIIFSLFATIWTNRTQFKVGEYQTSAEFLRVLADKNCPNSARILALASMYEKHLVDPDILLEAAYAMEDETRSRLHLQLFYLIGREKVPLRSPIGYLNLVPNEAFEPKDGRYEISGWALDAKGIDAIQLLVDGQLFPQQPTVGIERADIEQLFPGISTAEVRRRSGFAFYLPEGTFLNSTHFVIVRLWNRSHRFREIFSRPVQFLPERRAQ